MDNGIGLVFCFVVFFLIDLVYLEIEVFFIMSEEVGMEGVLGLCLNWLIFNIMINIDIEDNGEIYIGCVGGENVEIYLFIEFEKVEG